MGGGRLPAGYTACSELRSHGVAYIDYPTLLRATNGGKLRLQVQVRARADYWSFFRTVNRREFIGNNHEGVFGVGHRWGWSIIRRAPCFGNYDIGINYKALTLLVNGDESQLAIGDFVDDRGPRLMGGEGFKASPLNGLSLMELWDATDELVGSLHPCYSIAKGEYGLYDIVGKSFLGCSNPSSTNFFTGI